MEMGRLPNFKKLAEMGSLKPSAPRCRPSARSRGRAFITGMTPGGPRHRRLHRPRSRHLHATILRHLREIAIDVTLSKIGDVHLPSRAAAPSTSASGKPFLGLSHRARHPGLDLEDPDQLSRSRRPPPRPSPAWAPRTSSTPTGSSPTTPRIVRGLPEPRGRRGPLRRRQQERRPLEPPRAGQLVADPQGHQPRPLRQHHQDPVHRLPRPRGRRRAPRHPGPEHSLEARRVLPLGQGLLRPAAGDRLRLGHRALPLEGNRTALPALRDPHQHRPLGAGRPGHLPGRVRGRDRPRHRRLLDQGPAVGHEGLRPQGHQRRGVRRPGRAHPQGAHGPV